MTNLVIIHQLGLRVPFALADIAKLEVGKAGDWYNQADCDGNGIAPDEPIIRISFKDGNVSTFGSEWVIIFE